MAKHSISTKRQYGRPFAFTTPNPETFIPAEKHKLQNSAPVSHACKMHASIPELHIYGSLSLSVAH